MIKRITYLILVFVMLSCQFQNKPDQQGVNNPSKNDTKKVLEKANKYLIRTEAEDIENYIRRHDLEMEETGSGLRYMFLEHGDGIKAETGKIAVLNYRVSLLTGDLIYSSEEDGQKTFVIGKGNVESGLEEAILFLCAGDKVKLILPAHLAFGLLGDNNKIPPRTTLIHEVQVLEIK